MAANTQQAGEAAAAAEATVAPAEEEKTPEITPTESLMVVNAILKAILTEDISDSNFLKNEIDPVAIIAFADRIDRPRLCEAHLFVQNEKREVMRKNELLKRNLLKHFRMKKVFRAYNADNPELVNELYTKYRDGLDKLDTMIASLKRMSEDCSQKLMDIHEKRENMIVAKVENLALQIKEIQETTRRLQSSQTGHYLPEHELGKYIYRMDSVRQRISDVRLLYIKTIDTHTEIDNLAKSLEDLGGGLRMIDFEQLRAERQSLSDKIEERNNELARLRLRCNGDTQILAHVREKDYMLDNYITKRAEELEMYTEEMFSCRNFVNERKTERDHIRRQYSQMSHSVGLLDKPSLLHNYDKVAERIDAKQSQIDRLQRSIASTVQRMNRHLAELQSDHGLPRTRSQQKLDVAKAPYLPWVREGVPYKRGALVGRPMSFD